MEPNMSAPAFVTVLDEFAKTARSAKYHRKRRAVEHDKAVKLLAKCDPSTVNVTFCAEALGVTRVTLTAHLNDARLAADGE